jgi:hypothetical protein
MDKLLTPTTVEDVEYIAPKLRTADKNECQAATGKEPLDVLLSSLEIGDLTLTLRTPQGERVGLCGVVASHLDNAGIIWMCATDDIYQHQMTFLRNSKAALAKLSQGYTVFHMKWLDWMGFTFINKHENYGAENRPFYEFLRINNHV